MHYNYSGNQNSHDKKGGMFGVRPKTAATTSVVDESRIKDRLKYLETIETRLEKDMNQIVE